MSGILTWNNLKLKISIDKLSENLFKKFNNQ